MKNSVVVYVKHQRIVVVFVVLFFFFYSHALLPSVVDTFYTIHISIHFPSTLCILRKERMGDLNGTQRISRGIPPNAVTRRVRRREEKRIFLSFFIFIFHFSKSSKIVSSERMASFDRPLQIKSKDIDPAKFSLDNVVNLRGVFPNVDDETIGRFLIARNDDREKAEALLGSAEKWRSHHFPILKQDCMNELRRGVVYSHGYDKEGRPMLIMATRRNDPNNRDLEEMGRACIWMFETVIRRLPDDKSKITILFDRTDTGVDKQDHAFMKNMIKVLQDKYPERLHRAIVYPTGVIYWALWNIVKWFLDPVTAAKAAPMMYLSGVQEFIDDEYIPVGMVRSL
jgi:hypothetical protein